MRSISGNRCRRPDPGGHSISNVLLEIGFERPNVDHFAALLFHGGQRNETTQGGEVRLLGEFAPRRVEKIGAGLVEAFRDRPRSIVLLGPERAARMREQDLQLAHPPECQETRTDFCPATHRRNVTLNCGSASQVF
jgi:hypothetical protein